MAQRQIACKNEKKKRYRQNIKRGAFPVNCSQSCQLVNNCCLLQQLNSINFNKFDIRADASIDLNHVLTLLQKYPSMEIELMSHTDSRGTNKYNMFNRIKILLSSR